MSTLKVDNIRHNNATTDALVLSNDGSVAIGTCTAKLSSVGGGQLSNRNKARNGEMKISQRETTFSPTTSDMYLIDGWMTQHGSGGNLDCTVTQSSDAPAGFAKSLKITPDSTNTPSGSQNGMLAQRLEGQELQDFAFGTSDAKTITVSWYAKTSATGAGNYTVKVEYSPDGTQGNVYAVNKLFAFTTSWTRYTYTIPATGTATSVGIVDSSAFGFRIEYHLFAGPDDVHSQFTQWTSHSSPTYKVISGQKNFMDNTNNELYITGLQIEVGDTATSFEHRSISEELLRCQRYFKRMRGAVGGGGGYGSSGDGAVCTMANWTNTAAYGLLPLGVEMRYAPKLTGFANLNYFSAGNTWAPGSGSQCYLAGSSYDRVELTLQGMSNMSQGNAGWLRIDNPSGYMDFDAEL